MADNGQQAPNGVPLSGQAVFDQDLYGASDKYAGYAGYAIDDDEADQEDQDVL